MFSFEGGSGQRPRLPVRHESPKLGGSVGDIDGGGGGLAAGAGGGRGLHTPTGLKH